MSIFVEILVRAPMEALWAHTQTPALHQRWDLRFSRIEYLPRIDDSAPQQFRYATRIGFGHEVIGSGETLGQRNQTDGSSTSALKFHSDGPPSLILEGSGYWKYIPTVLIRWSRAWPAWVCLVSMPIATATVAFSSPAFFEAAFNPFSLNVAVASLAAVDLLVLAGVPSAARCRRLPDPEHA